MPTYTPLQSIQLVSTATTVTFSNIPQNYQDLVLMCADVSTRIDDIQITFNGDSSAVYSRQYLAGNGSGLEVGRSTNATKLQFGYWPSGTTGFYDSINIMNYSNSTSYKTALCKYGQIGSWAGVIVGNWRKTDAITSITLTAQSNSFNAGSTFDLYGISPVAAQTAQAFGGTEIYYDSSYVYHVFKGSGTFTPYRNLTLDYLVVAGGGGGGGGFGAGGGAGGLRSTVGATGGGGSLESSISVTSGTAYTITVGAGGVRGLYDSTNSTNGGNSSIAGSGLTTITSTGGGQGRANTAASQSAGSSAANGGSGGGGAGSGTSARLTAGTGTANQGYAGGSGYSSAQYGSGGGGGAGAAGTNGSTYGGAGGNGVQITTLATPTSTGANSGYYAGGGGGGSNNNNDTTAAGGLGGGGASANIGISGTTNTGSGGGGSTGETIGTTAGGNGGSGIVILRYAR